ncbi:uncharacterized protein PG986_001563 [Apiospora aurea]|uniref:Uncharacterized protein n=1 Tax=Apiospora aurea TaxID=335848 RepID=A0ABR1QX59_9PEZI
MYPRQLLNKGNQPVEGRLVQQKQVRARSRAVVAQRRLRSDKSDADAPPKFRTNKAAFSIEPLSPVCPPPVSPKTPTTTTKRRPSAVRLKHDTIARRDPETHIDTNKMLYELIGIVRPGNLAEVKEIVSTTGALILRERGVIRGLSNWGVFSLPRAVSVHQMRHTTGHYFAMRYDAGVDTQNVKLGDGKLDTMSRIGAIGWQRLGMGDEKRA